MIVADTNLIAYLFIAGEHSQLAERALRKDPRWAAPVLWRSEFRSVLAKCVREGYLSLEDAVLIVREAEGLVAAGGEYAVNSPDVLELAAGAKCSAYDAEFIVLARDLGVPLVTADMRLAKDFPGTALSLDRFVA